MAKHEWKIGEMTITIEAPDGVPVRGAMVSVKPQDRAEFLSAADTLGGLEALMMPSQESGYSQHATAYAKRDDDTALSEVAVMLYEPPRPVSSPQVKPPHAFFSPLLERRERERRRRLEDA